MGTPQEQAANGVVVGMKALTGEVGTRYDIDVLLVEQPDTFNLFLQAMAKLQEDPKTLGYYALSGIHGLPSETWDNVKRIFKDRFGGYCAHGVLVFPTWHRPYLALFEQTLYLKMVELANGYNAPHQQRYLAAAKKFRLPYLDYFRPRDGEVKFPGRGPNDETKFPYNFRLPDVFNEKRITVRVAPDDSPRERDNPLYTYKFTKESGQFSASDQAKIKNSYSLKQTVRFPPTLDSDTHNLDKLSISLNSGREGRAALFLDLINSAPYQSLGTVASDQTRAPGDMTGAPLPGRPEGSGSLEGSIHGNYHNLIGGTPGSNGIGGHMSTPVLAAFDPVFWFHHCQVDRAWALWEAMHPGSWFPKPKDPSQKPENLQDLIPFYKSRKGPGDGEFYNSDETRSTAAFGYLYDDFVGISDSKVVWENLKGKYVWATRFPDDNKFEGPPANMKPLNKEVRASQFFKKVLATRMAAAPTSDASTTTSSKVASMAASVTETVAAVAQPVMLQAQVAMQAVPTMLSATPVAMKISPKFDREWYVDSKVKRAAANGPFTIFFFLAKPGELTTNPDDYAVSPYLAGLNHIFAAPREFCDNCGNLEAAGVDASDTTPITPLLLDYLDEPDSGLASLQPEDVKPWLVKHLRWRVIYFNEGVHDPRDVPDFEISVSAKVSHDDGTKTYEDYPDVIPEILRNASATATATTSS